MGKVRVATVWLDGCSGCHMSFLDTDERLLVLAEKIEVVYSPIVDAKKIPENIDLAMIEGAVSNEDDLERVTELRKNAKLVLALGDCAVTSNVPGMRNPLPLKSVCERAYLENVTVQPQIPNVKVPKLFNKARPVNEVIKVDIFVPGCPPSADTIFTILSNLLEGKNPNISELTRFGA